MCNRKTEKFINHDVDQKIVKKTVKKGVKKMEKVENVVLEKENVNVGGLEKEKVVEKTVNGQNGQTQNQTTKMTLADLVMQRLQSLNVDIAEIEFLNAIVQELKNIETEIERLEKRKSDLRTEARGILEKISDEAKRILEILGLVNFEEIEKMVYASFEYERTKRNVNTVKTERGNGVSDKRIVYQGKEYRIASYFMRKMGISGGLKGLEEWARQRGFSLKIDDDVIFIV
jgi:TolA-binding protein